MSKKVAVLADRSNGLRKLLAALAILTRFPLGFVSHPEPSQSDASRAKDQLIC